MWCKSSEQLEFEDQGCSDVLNEQDRWMVCHHWLDSNGAERVDDSVLSAWRLVELFRASLPFFQVLEDVVKLQSSRVTDSSQSYYAIENLLPGHVKQWRNFLSFNGLQEI